MQYSTKYIFGFAAVICVVCSMMISISAVGLRARQELNKQLDIKKSVLQACQLAKPGEKLNADKVASLFENIDMKVIALDSGDYAEVDAEAFDPSLAPSKAAPANAAQVQTLPEQVRIYQVMKEGKLETLVLPIEGKGLWSTLYGFLALEADGVTVRGITYYQHGETPGLGGEVDNPKWKSLWLGRKVYNEQGEADIRVIKGPAGTPQEDPHQVDGLSGATLTSRGVTYMLDFWLSANGYGPFLKKIREGQV